MTELIVTRGLPASGKTTWAREWVAEDEESRARVNRDDLREQLYGRPAPLPHGHEQLVSMAEEKLAASFLSEGKSVVIDATHLKSSYIRRWVAVARKYGAQFSIKDFTFIDTQTCIVRDRDRGLAGDRWVGEDVIKDMAARLKNAQSTEEIMRGIINEALDGSTFYTYEPDEALLPAWIFDIDGTLALMNGRSPYDTSRAGEDSVNSVVNLVKLALQGSYRILVVSGREEAYREITEDWFRRNRMACNDLFMRKTGDKRNDAVIKQEIFEEHIAPYYRVLGVFDDRDRVVAMWRRIGLTCFQVAPGDF